MLGGRGDGTGRTCELRIRRHAHEAPHGTGREGKQEARGLEGPVCTAAPASPMLGAGGRPVCGTPGPGPVSQAVSFEVILPGQEPDRGTARGMATLDGPADPWGVAPRAHLHQGRKGLISESWEDEPAGPRQMPRRGSDIRHRLLPFAPSPSYLPGSAQPASCPGGGRGQWHWPGVIAVLPGSGEWQQLDPEVV